MVGNPHNAVEVYLRVHNQVREGFAQLREVEVGAEALRIQVESGFLAFDIEFAEFQHARVRHQADKLLLVGIGGQLESHQLVNCHAECVGQYRQHFQVRGSSVFPFADRLVRNMDDFRQFFLGHAFGFPQLLNRFADRVHALSPFLFWLCHNPCKEISDMHIIFPYRFPGNRRCLDFFSTRV